MQTIVIGTRGSKLALWQAECVKREILNRFPHIDVRIEVIKTTGDKFKSADLSKIGRQGVFTKEIEDALLEKRIDAGIHSLKDMPVDLPEGLIIGAVLERINAHDALISQKGISLDELPPGATIATGSLRRRAQLSIYRRDFEFAEIRGNVDTRVKKILDGYADAAVLSAIGLTRIGLDDTITQILDYGIMLPAAGQGVIAIESRVGELEDILSQINHPKTQTEVFAERSFLRATGGGCKTPIGCLASIDQEKNIIEIRAGIFSDPPLRKTIVGNPRNAKDLSLELAKDLLSPRA